MGMATPIYNEKLTRGQNHLIVQQRIEMLGVAYSITK